MHACNTIPYCTIVVCYYTPMSAMGVITEVMGLTDMNRALFVVNASFCLAKPFVCVCVCVGGGGGGGGGFDKKH